jgi:hypothetical protein
MTIIDVLMGECVLRTLPTLCVLMTDCPPGKLSDISIQFNSMPKNTTDCEGSKTFLQLIENPSFRRRLISVFNAKIQRSRYNSHMKKSSNRPSRETFKIVKPFRDNASPCLRVYGIYWGDFLSEQKLLFFIVERANTVWEQPS